VRRPLIILTVALVVLAGCSSDGDDGAASATSTTAAVSTSSTGGVTGSSVPAECPQTPRFDEASATPTQGAALADGLYFGYITFLDAEDLSMRFDVAQLLTGDAAAKAAAEDGGEANNDYWIRNASKATRTLKLADDATLCAPVAGDIVENKRVSLADLNQTLADGEPFAVWIDVRSGTVERVQHQYFP
jgi:hypothetical protein